VRETNLASSHLRGHVDLYSCFDKYDNTQNYTRLDIVRILVGLELDLSLALGLLPY
jgi:hypothetical protein